MWPGANGWLQLPGREDSGRDEIIDEQTITMRDVGGAGLLAVPDCFAFAEVALEHW